jgi:hypothetical protein
LEVITAALFSHAFLAKFDRNGTPLWAKQAESQQSYVNFRGLALASDGIWASGFCKSPTTFGTNTVFSSSDCIGFPTCTSVWMTSGALAKISESAAPASPLMLINSQKVGGNFQFSFSSQTGFIHTVESRTNLSLGAWQTRSNITGDGILKTIQLPSTSQSTEFFRVNTH